MAEIEPEAELVDVEPPEHALAERLGTVLRQRRVAMGMRQDELALAAGVGRRFIIDLEAGKSSCQLGKAMLVAEVLGLRVIDTLSAAVQRTGPRLEAAEAPDRASFEIQEGSITQGQQVGDQEEILDLPDDLEEPSP